MSVIIVTIFREIVKERFISESEVIMNFNLFNEIATSIMGSLNIQMPAQQPIVQENFNPQPPEEVVPVRNNVGFTFEDLLSNFINNPPEDLDSQIAEAIASASIAYEIDPNLIRAVIRTESSYNPLAVSHAGAMGLMQLMPGTAASLGVTDPFDIHQNVHGGTRYLRRQLDRFDGNLELALAAYNAGSGAVRQHGGVPPFRETLNYIPRVQRHKQNYLLEQYRINNSAVANE